MTDAELKIFGEKIVAYCAKFDVPIECLFKILEDQKVTPMIRGKAMEYSAFLLLEKILNPDVWDVSKMNLNPQPGKSDEDISIRHRRTGITLKVESKSASRGSMKDGKRTKKIKGEAHFTVKCHRSRSNTKKVSNDRYSADSFDVQITNPQNAIYKGKTVGEDFEMVGGENLMKILAEFYGVKSDKELVMACYNDWRFCIPTDIAENGFIPRTPYVKLKDDQFWKPLIYVG